MDLFSSECITQREKDPKDWHYLACSFKSAAKLLRKEFDLVEDGTPLEKSAEKFSAMIAIPYIIAVSAELYMKSYLLQKGFNIEHLKEIRHDLKRLRQECSNFDKKFDGSELEHLCDIYGTNLTKNGGAKYPGRSYVSFISWFDTLDYLHQATNPFLRSEEDKQGTH